MSQNVAEYYCHVFWTSYICDNFVLVTGRPIYTIRKNMSLTALIVCFQRSVGSLCEQFLDRPQHTGSIRPSSGIVKAGLGIIRVYFLAMWSCRRDLLLLFLCAMEGTCIAKNIRLYQARQAPLSECNAWLVKRWVWQVSTHADSTVLL